jgi:hypothetical protein
MFLDEIASRLVSAGVGVLGTTLFLSSAAKLPSGNGPYITLTETSGVANGARNRVHNEAGTHVQSPGAQVAVRAMSYVEARTKAKAAYAALDGTWNTTIAGVFYQQIVARQQPTDLGLDEAGRVVVVFNIDAIKQPS